MNTASDPGATTLLGRDGDIAAVLGLIQSGARVVAISGLGGMGKSALADAVADASRVDGRRTVRIDLSTAADHDDFLDALASGFGAVLKEPTVGGRLETLGMVLEQHPSAVVVFDDFESVQPVASESLGLLAHRAPQLTFLVTTRTALDLRTAHQFRLGPLPTRAAVDGARSPAAELFARRAQQVRPSIRLEAHGDAIDAIVERLGGIPLAIELAAALASVLSVPQILDHLHLDLTRRRAGRARGDSVFAAIDWAWQFLDEVSRTAMARISVFEGPFDFEAALHVLDLALDEAVDALRQLVAASLLILEESAWSKSGLQYRVLEVVRHHAAVRLDDRGDREPVFERYAEYYLEAVAPDDSSVSFDYTDDSLRFFAANHHHYTAIARGAAPGSSCVVLRALLRLGCAPHLRDAPRRLLAVFAPAIDRCRALVETERRVRVPLVCALLEAAHLHQEAAQRAEAVACIDEADALVRRMGLDALGPCVELARGMSRVHAGEVTRARGHLDAALRAFEARDDHAALPWIYLYLMYCAERESEFDRALELGRALLERLDVADSSYMRCTVCTIRSCTLFAMGLREACEHCVALGMAAAEKAGAFLSHVQVSTCVSLALFEHAWGRLRVAERHLVEARDRLQPDHPALVRADTFRRLGTLLHEQRRYAEALEAHRQAAEYYGTMASGRIAWTWVAIDLAVMGRAAEAAEARARAEAYPASRSTETTSRLLDVLWGVVTGAPLDGPAEGHHALTRVRRMPNHVVLLRIIDTEWVRRDPDVRALRVSPDFRRLRAPGGPWVDLARRRVLRALLEHLVNARLRHPGAVSGEDELMNAGWPDERRASSLRQRLHSNLHNLRELGLREVLLTHDDGWSIDPSVPTFVEPSPG